MKKILIPLLFVSVTAFGQFTKPQLYTNINTNIRNKTASQTRIAAVLDSLVKSMELTGNGSFTVASFAETLAGTDNTKGITPLRLRQVAPKVYNVEAYGAVHDGKRVYDGVATASSTTITSVSNQFTSGDVGKVIQISGAGSAGTSHVTTIATFVNSGQITISVAASTTTTASVIDWGTDDTASIQAANNACYAAGGGTVYFPIGIYIINGALQTSVDGVNPNSQLYIKASQITSSPINLVAVKWLGEESFNNVYYFSDINKGAILRSTLKTGSGTSPAVVGTKGLVGSYLDFSYDKFSMENIIIQVSSNKGASVPQISGFNGINMAQGEFKNCVFTVDSDLDTTTDPTGSGIFGLWLGKEDNNGPNLIEGCSVGGFEYGFVIGEHTRLNHPYAFCNLNGFVFLQSNYETVGFILGHRNKNHILIPSTTIQGVTAGSTTLNIEAELEGLYAGRWFTTVNDVSDVLNASVGSVRINTISPGVIDGASNLSIIPGNQLIPQFFTQGGGRSVKTFGSGQAGYGEHAGVIEANSGNNGTAGPTNATADDYFGTFQLVAKQPNTTSFNPVGVFQAVNSALGTTDKRIYGRNYFTNGATNTGASNEFYNVAGTQTTTAEYSGTGYSFLVPTVIGGSTITNSSTILDLQSTSKALILPRVTNTAAVTTPVNGMTIYDVALNKFRSYENGAWVNTIGGGVSDGDKGDITVSSTGTVWKVDFDVSSVTTTTHNETATSGEKIILIDAATAGGTVTVNLPTAVGNKAKIHIKKTDSGSNTIIIDGSGSETIDGSVTFPLYFQNQSLTLVSNGTNWFII